MNFSYMSTSITYNESTNDRDLCASRKLRLLLENLTSLPFREQHNSLVSQLSTDDLRIFVRPLIIAYTTPNASVKHLNAPGMSLGSSL